jgi:peptidyl-prolyl cis-trans isomerase SurA
MTFKPLLTSVASSIAAAILLTTFSWAQAKPAAPESPYGGTTVEEIIARVNDRIITRSDYERAQAERDQELRQRGASMQDISASHKDLLRDLIDQQLWLTKGKELGITGETELINRLNDIRKQYNMATMEDLEKAAKEQGVSFEDFKANIRNQIVTQEVMRDQVGRRIAPTPGEIQRYFDAHKQDYAQPESVKLGEILVSTGTNPDDQKLAEAKAKADDVVARLHAGGDFSQLARSFSDGTTAAQGGDLGQYKRGQLDKVFEEKTFGLKTGEFTDPIRTKQGYVILKVNQHIAGGVPQLKDVEGDVEQNYFMSKMEPAMREYLAKMRDEAAIYIKPGYEDSAATAAEKHPSISFSAYTPPSSKKKKKVERTRFRETTHGFRQKSPAPVVAAYATAAAATTTTAQPAKVSSKKGKSTDQASMKPGKKEKIRYGKAPQTTLPSTPAGVTEDAGAGTQVANAAEPDNPLESAPKPEKKTRYSDRAKQPKQPKPKGPQLDPQAPSAPDAAEVADTQAQAGPLGLGGNSTAKKKKKSTTTGDKTRMSDKKNAPTQPEDTGDKPLGAAPQVAPSPAQQVPAAPQAAPAPQQQ